MYLPFPAHVQLLQAITLCFGYTTLSWIRRYNPALRAAIQVAAEASHGAATSLDGSSANAACYLDQLQRSYHVQLHGRSIVLIAGHS